MKDSIEQKCIDKGVKLTDQRKIIAKVMTESDDHPDVDELYKRVSKIVKPFPVTPEIDSKKEFINDRLYSLKRYGKCNSIKYRKTLVIIWVRKKLLLD